MTHLDFTKIIQALKDLRSEANYRGNAIVNMYIIQYNEDFILNEDGSIPFDEYYLSSIESESFLQKMDQKIDQKNMTIKVNDEAFNFSDIQYLGYYYCSYAQGDLNDKLKFFYIKLKDYEDKNSFIVSDFDGLKESTIELECYVWEDFLQNALKGLV